MLGMRTPDWPAMPWPPWFPLVVTTVTAVMAQTSPCPYGCQCLPTPFGTNTICRNVKLESIPQNIPSDTTLLDLGLNTFQALNSSMFPPLPELRILALDNCSIMSIQSRTFENMPQLQNVTLRNNRISTIHRNAFQGIPHLQYLYLENNRMEALPDFVFREMNLVELFLDGNSITELTNGAFVGVRIQNLNLNRNQIGFLSGNAIGELSCCLRTLELSGNQVPLTIDRMAFQGFTLDLLLVAGSQISDHSFMEFLTCKTLDISDNLFLNFNFRNYHSLSSVESLYARALDMSSLRNTLNPFTNLKMLNLASNNLFLLHGRDFSYIRKLETLDLSSNPFMSLPSDLGDYLPQLRTLIVHQGHLMQLTSSTFQGMANLTSLDLRANKLQVIPREMLPVLASIGPLIQLSGNPFHCNCEMRWFREWAENLRFMTGAEMCISPMRGYFLKTPPENFTCSPPEVVRYEETIVAVRGSDIYMTCTAQGNPAPEVEIIAPSGEVLRISPPLNRTSYRTSATWRLKNVDNRVVGLYTCNAMNLEGMASASTDLQVALPTTTTTTTSTTPSPTTPGVVGTTDEDNRTVIEMNTTLGYVSSTVFNMSTSTPLPYDEYGGRWYIYGVGVVAGCLMLSLIVIVVYCLLHRKLYKRKYDVNEAPPTFKELNTRNLITGHGHDVIRNNTEENQLLPAQVSGVWY